MHSMEGGRFQTKLSSYVHTFVIRLVTSRSKLQTISTISTKTLKVYQSS
jgi:ERCC4-type nuclease